MYNNALKSGSFTKEEIDKHTEIATSKKLTKFNDWKAFKVVSSCKSKLDTSYKKEKELISEFSERVLNKYLDKERAVFLKRTGRKIFCKNADLAQSFLLSRVVSRVNEDCIYKNDGSLKVAYTLHDGVIADSVYNTIYPYSIGRYIFLTKNNPSENNLVDGSRVEPGYFVYSGIRTGALGSSVYNFRRFKADNLFKDIYFYNGKW